MKFKNTMFALGLAGLLGMNGCATTHLKQSKSEMLPVASYQKNNAEYEADILKDKGEETLFLHIHPLNKSACKGLDRIDVEDLHSDGIVNMLTLWLKGDKGSINLDYCDGKLQYAFVNSGETTAMIFAEGEAITPEKEEAKILQKAQPSIDRALQDYRWFFANKGQLKEYNDLREVNRSF